MVNSYMQRTPIVACMHAAYKVHLKFWMVLIHFSICSIQCIHLLEAT